MVTITLVFVVPSATDAARNLALATDAIQRTFQDGVFYQTAADATSTLAAAQAVAVALPFKSGDKVMVDGDTVQGEADVLECWAGGTSLPSKAKRDRPAQKYPQVEVQMLRSGKKYHFNGDDIDDGKLTILP